jgi:hypothetical protein
MSYPKKEYYVLKWNVTLDREPYGKWWDWMIEEDNNRAVYWHRTTEEPSAEDVTAYIHEHETDWS